MKIENNKNKIKIYSSMVFRDEKEYYVSLLRRFVALLDENKVYSVHFGKRDIRGVPRIEIEDKNFCVVCSIPFSTNRELMSYIRGVVEIKENFGKINEYLL